MITEEQIEKAKRNTKYSLPPVHDEHITSEYEYLMNFWTLRRKQKIIGVMSISI